jgi:4-aminobutyrate aminotransferase
LSAVPLYDLDQQVLAACGKLRFSPLAIESAHGSSIVDSENRVLVDFSAGGSAAGLGYAHPAIVAAVTEAVGLMPGVGILLGAHRYAVDLAQRLLELTPTAGADRCAYLGLSGSDANSAVLRAVRTASLRPKVLAFEHSYHGGIGPAQGISGVWAPGGTQNGQLVLVPYGDAGAVEAALSSRDVAAVFIEPILSDGGLVFPPEGFLESVRKSCSTYGSWLVVDEVKVGLGRTGLLHAFEHAGIEPDVVTLGKSLGGGLPISAVVGPRMLLGAQPASSLLTLAGNPVGAAAALAVLDVVASPGFVEEVARKGRVVSARLHSLKERHPLISDVRSAGLVAGIELRKPTGQPAATATVQALYRAWELGVTAISVGPDRNVIELTPPLIITDEELREGFDRLDSALADVAAGKLDDRDLERFAGWG